jgi:Tol biopolymer transport system component
MKKNICIITIIIVLMFSFKPQPCLGVNNQERIVFFSDRDGNRQIYSINSDGTDERRLTHNKYNDEYPACSPDGTKIAFTSNRDGYREIYIMNLNGSNQVRLTKNKKNYWGPAWSSDGSKLFFTSVINESISGELYCINVDGSNLKRLGIVGVSPALSKDGKKIAFASEINTRDDMILDIYTMNIDGTQLTRLTSNGRYNSPAWTPNGKKIIYTSEDEKGIDKLYIMDSDGKNKVKITKDKKNTIYCDPVWSPDGKRIACIVNERTRYEFNICVMNADGTNQIRLTNKKKGNFHPSWARVHTTEEFPTKQTEKLPITELAPAKLLSFAEFKTEDEQLVKKASGMWSTIHPIINLNELKITGYASSALAAKYSVTNAVDGNPATAWVEGAPGGGAGDWVRLKLDAVKYSPTTTPFSIAGIGIVPGYAKNQKTWAENNRVKTALVVVHIPNPAADQENEWVVYRLRFKDENKLQFFELPAVKRAINMDPMTATVWIKIEAVYQGTKYDDTCISEVVIVGGCLS